ncbi:unnamed protein product [Brassica oleracea var. botrytis]
MFLRLYQNIHLIFEFSRSTFEASPARLFPRSPSLKTNGEAAVPPSPVKPVPQTGVSYGDVNPMKSKGVTAETKNPIKPIGKTGASSGLNLGVRGRASVSSGAKGKAIVSDNAGKFDAASDLRGDLYGKFSPHYTPSLFVLDCNILLIMECLPRIMFSYRLRNLGFIAGSSLADYIGHIKLVNGKVPSDSLLLDEAEIAASRRVELLVQTHDDPVMKLYLWDKAAFEFYEKFKASGGTARVILVTTLNPKRFGGVLSLSAMASSQVFLDSDVQETLFYLSWLNSNLDVASRVNAEVVTKPEPATLGELFSYMNQASAKCTATIDGVVHCSGWYYIGCGVCHTKATKGPTTLMCKKCGKSEIIGVAQYLTKLSVYDRNDQAVFVVLGDAGEELTGKKAAVLVERYYQANDSVGGDHIVSVPQAMIDTIGQTRKFIVKVSNHNLTAKTQTLTVTKVLPLEAPKPEGNLRENVGEEADTEREDHADESVKRGADGIESEGVKRAKCG